MTESVGRTTTDGTSATTEQPYTLAEVLKREFRELHENEAPPALDEHGAPVPETKQQQPLADPSLAPVDDRAREQRTSDAEISKTPSQQRDTIHEAETLRTLYENVHKLPGDGRTALCLSGGGVRSAAFNLGVLQGLARLGLLNRFHYLSTVSGGGYIGCWLSAWRCRCEKGISDVSRGLSWPDRISNAVTSPRVPDAINNLRRSTNYLTPTTGILSPDTWATITIVARNLILNHVVIVPLVAALLLAVKFVGTAVPEYSCAIWERWHLGSLLIPGSLAVVGWIVLSITRPSWDVRSDSAPIKWAPRLGMGLVLLGAGIFALITAKAFSQGATPPFSSWERFAIFSIGGAVAALVAFVLAVGLAIVKRALCKIPKAKGAVCFLGYVPDAPPGLVTIATAGIWAVLWLALAATVAGFAGGGILGAGEELAAYLPKDNPRSTALLLCIAFPWFVISYNAVDAVYVGLTARKPSPKVKQDWSDRWGDEEREWIARTAGYLTFIALSISILFLLTLFGPSLIFDSVANFSWTGPLGLAILGISGLASVGLAASPFSTHFGTAPHGVRFPVRKILTVATPIFSGLLVCFLSSAIDLALFKQPLLDRLGTQQISAALIDPTIGQGQLWLCVLFLSGVLVSCGAAFFVNINRFSLYDLYRMRLTREFLGASNRNRRPEFWTGFDETDDIPLAALWPPQDNEKRLYPVINAALNMAATKRVEWQERKAVGFVFTPLFCGSGATPDLGFRETKDYANGIRLGWAMSVSGAAMSPNSGYSTMPSLALLMTLFNLRLGVWSGNPGRAGDKTYRLRGPRNALRPLCSEAFARTNDQSKYVYLSDGGHFDNLGLYQMLRRRCRFIVVSDATADPDYVYADLGSVVRKAAIDFGIRITFKHLDIVRRGETAVKGAYSAFATIEYPEVHSSGRRRRGYLLYIKSYCGGLNEPADVRAYWGANPGFPHDSTMNQFFGEAQFESYRALGNFTIMELARQARFAGTSQATNRRCLAQFFRGALKGLIKSREARDGSTRCA
jgi:hypothetical protein